MNNKYPVITMPLASNNRAIDICPHQYVTLTFSETDTERGITWSAQKLIPRHVSFSHNSGRLITDAVCEYLIENAAKSYEVTCPNEPDNDPEQPQDEKPTEPTWPDIGIGEVLTRNSWLSGGTYDSIDDPIAIKSIAGMPSYPNCKKLSANTISSNVVSSNMYVYFITIAGSAVAHRVAIKSGGTDKSVSVVISGETRYNYITLLEENVIAFLTVKGDYHSIKALDFSTGEIRELTDQIPAHIEIGADDLYYDHTYGMKGIYTVKGTTDGKLYIVTAYSKIFYPDGLPTEFNKIAFSIYNYTDDVLYDFIELDTDPISEFGDLGDIWQYTKPAIVDSEIVFNFYENPDNNILSLNFYCINVETQTGQVCFWNQNSDDYYDYFSYVLVSDRMYRNVYCLLDEDYNGDQSLDKYPIVRYNIATNSVTVESDNFRKDTGAGAAGNLSWLVQDKNYAYKIVNLYCSDTSGDPDHDKSNCLGTEMLPRVDRLLPINNETLAAVPPAIEYWGIGHYMIDDVSGAIYTFSDSELIFVNSGDYLIDINAVITDLGGFGGMFMQGDHFFVEYNYYIWVVY